MGVKAIIIPLLIISQDIQKIYLLRNKDEIGEKFLIYNNEVENQHNKKIKKLRTNRGGEYDSSILNANCENYGIIHGVTPPYSLEFNGIIKRRNRTLKNMVNATFVCFRALLNLWEGAILLACNIQNMKDSP